MKSALSITTLLLLCASAFGQQYKVLYSFQGPHLSDGEFPVAGLVADGFGNLYGTTRLGGPYGYPACPGCGTVFELSPNSDGSWSEYVLHAFCSSSNNEGLCLDGAYPETSLIIDSEGNLYGTTAGGGSNSCELLAGCGTVFELSPPTVSGGAWTETVLYNFCSVVSGGACIDGYQPISGLTFDSHGNLYGTTVSGGSGKNGGVVFELSPGSNGWSETILYNFCSAQGTYCLDGAAPSAGVTFDAAGNLYGTTRNGGAPNYAGGGTVYKLSPGSGQWSHIVLVSSRGGSTRGSAPLSDVKIDSLGYLYGTTSLSGPNGATGGIFRLSPGGGSGAGVFFQSGLEGCIPAAGVTLDFQANVMYGTASMCGKNGGGTIYTVNPSRQLTVLYNFCSQAGCTDGTNPLGALIEDASGNLYGTAENGGANGYGVVFEITP